MLEDFRLLPLNGGAPGRVVIFLHGLGDRGDGGLLSIGDVWREALPDCEFLCPDAPFVFDMAPEEFGGRQWFSLQQFTAQSVAEGVTTAAPILNDYIDQVLADRNLTPAQLALVGFSQGTMMALHVALRRDKPLAAVLGYSGMLAMPDRLAAELRTALPVMLVHGTADEVVPYASLAAAETTLKAAQVPVEVVTCPDIAHTIDERGLVAGCQFLLRCFNHEEPTGAAQTA